MAMRGTDGVMLARNYVLAQIERGVEITPEICEITNWVICGDEGLPVEAVFPPEVAERLSVSCLLACPLPRRDNPKP